MEKIKINGKNYNYQEVELYLGRKKIDKKLAKKNLLDLKKILDRKNVNFLLGYGTLLGVIRENDFISHDEDTDILVLDSEKEKFLECMDELEAIQFIICRYDERGILSLIRNNEYIDVYFFKKYKGNIYKCATEFLDEKYLKDTKKIEFLDEYFKVSKEIEKLLEYWYGKSWRTPIVYDSCNKSKILFLKNKLKKRIPKILKSIIYYYKEKKAERMFMKKNMKI